MIKRTRWESIEVIEDIKPSVDTSSGQEVKDPTSPIFFDEKSARTILDRLYQKQFDSKEDFRLRCDAEELSLVPGFDKLISLEANMVDEYEHQIEAAYTVLKKMRGRAILADEVGLGKTIEAGIIMKELIMRGLARKILVLTPASLVTQWKEELETKFLEQFEIGDYVQNWSRFDKIVASIDRAKRPDHAEEIQQIHYDLLIIDEAHKLKNNRALVSKFVNSIKKKYVLLLTATPVHNELKELFNLITVLRPGHLRTSRHFMREYVDPADRRKPKNTAQLKALLSEVMIRNRRSRVKVKFPKRTAYTFSFDLTPQERNLYDAITNYARSNFRKVGEILSLVTLQKEISSSSFAAINTLRKMELKEGITEENRKSIHGMYEMAKAISHNSKIDAIKKILKEAKDRVIIFSDFLQTQQYIANQLKDEGHLVHVFNGSLNAAKKDECVQKFKEKGGVFISTECGSEGRNLQFCNIMVNYDLPWNPMRVEQRIGRVHRLGQTREVHVFNLAAKNTIEAHVLDLLAKKIQMFELVIGELDLILGNMDRTETFEEVICKIYFESRSEAEVKTKLDKYGEEIVQAREAFANIKEAEVIVSKIFD